MKLVYSFLMLSTGSYLAYLVKKRRFGRINRFGTEEFDSSGNKVIANSIKKFLWWAAIACIAVGAILAL